MLNIYLERLFSLGFKLFPLKHNSKAPSTTNGFYDAKGEWSEGFIKTFRNWGVRTGLESGVIVLDIDPRNGGDASLKAFLEANNYSLPATLTVRTGNGGTHYYFQYVPGIPSRTNLFPGVDICSDGKYAVSPGSTLGPGKDYEIEVDVEPAPLPEWLLSVLTPTPLKEVIKPTLDVLPEGIRGELSKKTLKFLVEGAPEGTWNARLFAAAKDHLEQGYLIEEALERLEKVTGHLDKTDLKTIESAYRKAPKYEPRIPDEPYEALVFSEAAEIPTDQQGGQGKSLDAVPGDLLNEMVSYLTDPKAVSGTPTSIEGLNDLLGGGVREKEITILTAVSKSGKSSVAHYLIHGWLEKGLGVGYLSRELNPGTEVLPNLLSIACNHNSWKSKKTPEQIAEYSQMANSFPLHFMKGYGVVDFQEFTAWCDYLIDEKGVKLFVADHFHYMIEQEDPKVIAAFARELKSYVSRRKISLILIVQPRQLQEGMKISMHTLRGSAALAQAADNVILLERVANQKNISKLTLDAKRHQLARLGSIYLQYDSETTRFVEVEYQEGPPPGTPPMPFGFGEGNVTPFRKY